MRSFLAAAFVLIGPASAHAGDRVVGPEGVALPQPMGLPDRLYKGNVFTTGTDKVHVVIVESDDASKPARWTAIDDDGRVKWTADHACPDYDHFTELRPAAAAGRIVCNVEQLVIGVDLATGAEAWRFTDPRPVYVTVAAGSRVAVSIDNQQVAVLDAVKGTEVARWDTGGAVLEAAIETSEGPLALFVKSSDKMKQDSMELPIGKDGGLERIDVDGDDPGRVMLALAIGGPAVKGLKSMKPRWSVPFAGYSYDLDGVDGVIVGRPEDGFSVGYDALTGKTLWRRPEQKGELVDWGDDGGAFALRSDSGTTWGALAPKTGKPRWTKALELTDEPTGVGGGKGEVGIATQTGFVVASVGGQILVQQPLALGQQFVALRSTSRSVLWVATQEGERQLYLKRFPN